MTNMILAALAVFSLAAATVQAANAQTAGTSPATRMQQTGAYGQ